MEIAKVCGDDFLMLGVSNGRGGKTGTGRERLSSGGSNVDSGREFLAFSNTKRGTIGSAAGKIWLLHCPPAALSPSHGRKPVSTMLARVEFSQCVC